MSVQMCLPCGIQDHDARLARIFARLTQQHRHSEVGVDQIGDLRGLCGCAA